MAGDVERHGLDMKELFEMASSRITDGTPEVSFQSRRYLLPPSMRLVYPSPIMTPMPRLG